MTPFPDQRRERTAWLTVAFIVPVLIVFAAYTLVTNTSPHEKYSALTMRTGLFRECDFFAGADKDLRDSIEVREAFSGSDSQSKMSAFKLILTEHMSVVFIIAALLGPSAAPDILKIFFFLRFGLAGATSFNLFRKHIGLKNDPALLLAVVYSVSSFSVFYASLNTSLINGLIMMPLLLSSIDGYNRGADLRSGLIAVSMFALTAVSGIGGLMGCVPVCLISGMFMLLSDRRKRSSHVLKGVLKLVIAAAAGVMISAFAVIPMVSILSPCDDIKEIFRNGNVRFFMIDFLYGMLDGNVSGSSISEHMPVTGIFVITVMLLMLFFANRMIPLRAKAFAGIVMLLLYASVAYSPLDIILSGGRSSSVITYSRIMALLCFMLLLAAISLRNIQAVRSGTVYLAAFLMIGLIVIESSSASETSPNIFSKMFSALAVVFWCSVFVYMISKAREIPAGAVTAALFGIFFNVFFCLGPAGFATGDLTSSSGDITDPSADQILLREGEVFPIFAEDEQSYLVLSSYIRDSIKDADIAQKINIVSGAAMLDTVFYEIDSESVYLKDMTDVGAGRYRPEQPGVRGEITIRSTLPNEYSRYFVVSMFEGDQFVTESYPDHDLTVSFGGPFMFELSPSGVDAYIKLSAASDDTDDTGFRVYMLSGSGLAELMDSSGTIEDGIIDLSEDRIAGTSGGKTVVTSLPYDPSYRIRYESNGKTRYAETFDICGKLAFSFEHEADDSLKFDVIYTGNNITSGILISLISVICIILCILMYNNITRKNKEKSIA